MSAAKKMLGHLVNKLAEALLGTEQLTQSQHSITLHTDQQLCSLPGSSHRQMFAHLWCLMGWVPLSGDKASGKDWVPEKLDSITLCRMGPGCLSGFEYCSRENKIN